MIAYLDAERVNLLSQLMTPQDVQLCYQICLQGRQDLSFAPDGRTGLEMVLLRMLCFPSCEWWQYYPTGNCSTK